MSTGVDPVHAMCRSWGHAWVPYTVDKVRVNYLVRLRCARCETIRSQLLSSRGERLRGNAYKYAEGYLIRGADLHTTHGRELVRAEVLQRLLADDRKVKRERRATAGDTGDTG